jgi:hypothetical protein
MDYTFEFHQQLAVAVSEVVGLRVGYTDEKTRLINLNGLTRHNFILGVVYTVKDAQWRLRVYTNTAKGNKNELIESLFAELPEGVNSEWFRNSSRRVQFEVTYSDPDMLIEQAVVLKAYIESNDLGSGSVQAEPKCGVSFSGTQFDRLKERGATISGMFGNLVCQAANMNLLMMQAEYYVSAGEIDGVEFAEDGSIISIYECQSGIHHGEELDDEHTMKALGTYLYDSEIIPTVRKVVILAGAYSESDLVILRERGYELSRRERPIELVALITTREGNRIGVERVCL